MTKPMMRGRATNSPAELRGSSGQEATKAPERNARGDIRRRDLDRFAYEHHWQRPDGTVYTVDSSD